MKGISTRQNSRSGTIASVAEPFIAGYAADYMHPV